MRKQFLKTAFIALAGVGLLAGSAFAVPITGGLSMTGTWLPIDAYENQVTIIWMLRGLILLLAGTMVAFFFLKIPLR